MIKKSKQFTYSFSTETKTKKHRIDKFNQNQNPKGCGRWIWLLTIIIGLSIAGPIIGVMLGDGRKASNIIIEENGKSFLYSASSITHELENNETPRVTPPVAIIKQKGKLYVEPGDVTDLAQILSGNYSLHRAPDHLVDGYAQKQSNFDFIDSESTTQNTDKLGKQISTRIITLINKKGNQHKIIWSYTPKTKAIENCLKKRISTIQGTGEPGETIQTWPRKIVVPIDEINRFYGNKWEIGFSKKNRILTLVKKQ